VRFPSNWHLSQARAEAVALLIAPKLTDPARITPEGRSDQEPVAGNDTPEGRAANRRVEILLRLAG
jgi:type VI secretion system protein ImpK